jgi:hypothetical protein
MSGKRVLIVFNEGVWYVRRVALVEHDIAPGRDQMVYRCDEHISGPHRKVEVAVRSAQRALKESR